MLQVLVACGAAWQKKSAGARSTACMHACMHGEQAALSFARWKQTQLGQGAIRGADSKSVVMQRPIPDHSSQAHVHPSKYYSYFYGITHVRSS